MRRFALRFLRQRQAAAWQRLGKALLDLHDLARARAEAARRAADGERKERASAGSPVTRAPPAACHEARRRDA